MLGFASYARYARCRETLILNTIDNIRSKLGFSTKWETRSSNSRDVDSLFLQMPQDTVRADRVTTILVRFRSMRYTKNPRRVGYFLYSVITRNLSDFSNQGACSFCLRIQVLK